MSKPSPELVRAQRWITGVLVGLTIACVAAALAGLWPASRTEEWLGTSSLRARIGVAFAIYGSALLAALLVALAIKKLVRRR